MEAKTDSLSKWAIDPAHSEIAFKVKHLVISTVTGYFSEFSGGIESAGTDFSAGKVWFSAKTASINTNQAQRDEHLRSADFFNSERFPEMTFESTSIEKAGGDEYRIKGILKIKDTAKEIELKAEFGGTMVDGYGNTKAGFELSGSINRKDFGLTWSAVTEAGGVVVSDEVKLLLNVQLIRFDQSVN